MKDKNEVITEFAELVNMTADELESWLKSDDSNSAGWPKGDDGGESVGHASGRKIVEILQANPSKEPSKYTEEQIEHMRKVVAYCKRHLAQEAKANEEKAPEDVKKTKSYASLKNWGHDFLKAKGDASESVGGQEARAGSKRKQSTQQSGANKKRETRQGAAGADEDEDDEEDGDDAEDNEDDDDDDAEEEQAEEDEEEEESNGDADDDDLAEEDKDEDPQAEAAAVGDNNGGAEDENEDKKASQ